MEQPAARCASCEAELTDGARFCNRCGTAVEGSGPANDDPTGEIAMPDADAPTALITPDFESLAATHLIESFDTDQLERTARSMTVDGTALDAPLVWGDADRPFDDTIDDTPVSGISIEPDTTSALARGADDPTPVTPTARMQTPTAPTPLFRPTVMTAIGAVSVVALLVALTADIIAIETTAGPAMAEVADSIGLRTGIWHLGDLASNITVAGLLAAIGLAIGAVASAMGRSWGSGLIGGSGLSAAGVAGLAVGLVEYPIRVATSFASVGSAEPFTVTITRDLGYWSLIAAGGIGVVAFFASVNDMIIDRRNDLNPIVAAVGALAAAIAAVGPMVPTAAGTWSTNWVIGTAEGDWPTALLIGRGVQITGLTIGGVLGFLSVRRFGLGMIAGTIAAPMWMALTTWIAFGGSPIGPGHRNPGGSSSEVTGLTVVGVVATAAVLALAGAIAWDRDQHDPNLR
ncbi:MAG: zinc-ribbon domain-containing protein [Ilumatobacteraceae bacterium]